MISKYNIISEFLKNNYNLKSSNIIVIKDSNIIKLINYNTIIASKKINENKIKLNVKKYSQTTSRNQNLIKRLAQKNGFIIEEVNGF